MNNATPAPATVAAAATRHLVLATVDESVRPVSIRTLGAYAQSKGVKTTLLVIIKELVCLGHPVTFSDSKIRQVAAFLEREGVTHLGFSLMTASLKPYALLAKALRARGFKGVIMAGGVHATLCPEESLVDGADFAVQGWGELPLEMILDGKAPATIPGLVWRRDGAVRVNPTTPEQKKDLDSLPFPIFRFGEDRVLVKGHGCGG